MTKKRKLLLIVVLVIAIAAHIALLAGGSNWRTVGFVLVAVDVISALFIVGAIREFRKLDVKQDSN
jgi:membrane protein YdbS with pleckstrin-like domain